MRNSVANRLFAILLSFALLLSVCPVMASGGDAPEITVSDVTNGVQVTIRSQTAGMIYYTLDGTTPKESSAQYTGAFVLSDAKEYRIRAVTIRNGEKSDVASLNKTVLPCGFDAETDGSEVMRISATTTSGTYQVEFMNLDSYTVFYELGHTTKPTINSKNINDGTLYIKKPTYITLLICRKGYAPVQKTYLATQRAWASRPVVGDLKLEVQGYYGGKNVSFVSDTDDIKIRYMMSNSASAFNGVILDESNTRELSGNLQLDRADNYYIKAYGTKDGYFDSDPTSLLAVRVDKCAAPDVRTEDSSTNENYIVVTATSTDDSIIRYTTNGTTPNEGSDQFTSARTFSKDTVIKFVAMKLGNVNSNVVTVNLSKEEEKPAKPVFTKTSAVDGTATVTIESPDGADVYYAVRTTEGTYTPTVEDDELYTKPIVIDESGTYQIFARAYRNGKYSDLTNARFEVTILDGSEPPISSLEILRNGVKILRFSASFGNPVYYITSDEEITDTDVPLTEDNRYSYPISIVEDTYVTAVALNPDGAVSAPTQLFIGIDGGPVTPQKVGAISMHSEEANGAVKVTLDCADNDADLFYVYDKRSGTVATTKDNVYKAGDVLTLDGNGYLHVAAAKPGYEPNTRTFAINGNMEKTAAPVINAQYNSAGSNYRVTMTSATPGARFYYTYDNTVPTEASLEAPGGNAVVPGNVTLRVIAVADGYAPSDVTSQILSRGSVETCSRIISENEKIIGGVLVHLNFVRYYENPEDRPTIYYTTDGSEPTVDSLVYDPDKKIRITTDRKVTIKAFASKSGYRDGAVFEDEIKLTRLKVPNVSTAPGNGRVVIRALSDEGADVYYTLDGTIPNINSPSTNIYRSYIYSYENCTFTAVAAKEGYVTSYLYQNYFKVKDSVNLPGVDEIVRTPVMGGELVEIPKLTPGSTIFYSLEHDNISKVTPNRIYIEPIFISEEMNYITVLGTKNGLADQKIQYKIPLKKISSPPTASVENNSVLEAGTTVRLTAAPFDKGDSIVDCAIFYTTDGSVPTVNSTLYKGPIEINESTRIRAIAAAVGVVPSDVLELYYTVSDGDPLPLKIDASALSLENGLISGSVKVLFEDIDTAGRCVTVAVYCDDRLLTAVSQICEDNVSEAVLDGFIATTETDSSVIVKAFLFEEDNLTPVCRSATYIKN